MKNFWSAIIILSIVVTAVVLINNTLANGGSFNPDNAKTLPQEEETISGGKLIYATIKDGATTIFSVNDLKDTKELYSDKTSAEKITYINSALIQGKAEALTTKSRYAILSLNASNDTKFLDPKIGLQTDFAISPDQKKIAFIAFSNAEKDYGYSVNLINANGENLEKIYNSSSELSTITWSNNKLFFIKTLEKGSSLTTITLTGKETQDIYTTSQEIIDFSIGNNILISETNDKKTSKIYSINFNGKNKKFIYEAKTLASSMVASPDNNKIAFLDDTAIEDNPSTSIYEVNLKTKKINKIAQGIKILDWLP